MPREPVVRPVVAGLWVVAVMLVGIVTARLLGLERGSAPALVMGVLPWVLLPAYPLLVSASLLNQRTLTVVAAAVAVAHVALVLPQVTRSSRPCEGAALRVVTANLLKTNTDPEAAGRTLRALHPDVVVLPELTRRLERGLRAAGLMLDLPHPAVRLLRGLDTVGIYSRLPLSDVRVLDVPGQQWPQATMTVKGRPVRVTGVHTSAPRSRVLSAEWHDSMQILDHELQSAGTAGIASGDFNADRGHASFRALLYGGVRDAHEQRGRGLAPTWPAGHPFLHLDHVLVRDHGLTSINVCAVHEVRIPGSDHLAVVADLVVGGGQEPPVETTPMAVTMSSAARHPDHRTPV